MKLTKAKKIVKTKIEEITEYYFSKQYKHPPIFSVFEKEFCKSDNQINSIGYYYYRLLRAGCRFNKTTDAQAHKRKEKLFNKIKTIKAATKKQLIKEMNSDYKCSKTLERDIDYLIKNNKIEKVKDKVLIYKEVK